MNRACVRGIVALALIVWLSSDAWAWRGPGRGGPGPGGRPGGGSPGPGVAKTGHNPSGPAKLGTGTGMHGAGMHGPGAGGHLNANTVNSFLGTGAHAAGAARGQAIKNWDNLATKPFSPAWYAQHPAAWHATHPHADVWAAATAAGVAAWLAVPYATVSGVPVYVTESTAETPAPVTNVIVNNTTPQSDSSTPTSDNTTGLGGQTANAAGEWMALGVFAVGPKGAKETNRVVQLEISKEGGVRGLFVDTVTGVEQDITGSIDKKSAQMRWQIGPKGIAFESPVGEFTKPQGALAATLPDGKKAAWQVSQVKK